MFMFRRTEVTIVKQEAVPCAVAVNHWAPIDKTVRTRSLRTSRLMLQDQNTGLNRWPRATDEETSTDRATRGLSTFICYHNEPAGFWQRKCKMRPPEPTTRIRTGLGMSVAIDGETPAVLVSLLETLRL